MIKWPEPVIAREEYTIGSGEYYTEAQLKQAVRDALELAFRVVGPEDSYHHSECKICRRIISTPCKESDHG